MASSLFFTYNSVSAWGVEPEGNSPDSKHQEELKQRTEPASVPSVVLDKSKSTFTRIVGISIVSINSKQHRQHVYGADDSIHVEVTFSAPVNATISSESPTIALSFDDVVRYASYESGAGTRQLNFVYKIVEGDEDRDGIAIEKNSVSTNGSVISSQHSAHVELLHDAVPPNRKFRVDAQQPSPVFDDISMSEELLKIGFDESLEQGSIPPSTAFSIAGTEGAYAVENVQLVDEYVLLELSPTVVPTEKSLDIRYEQPARYADQIKDLLGNSVPDFSVSVDLVKTYVHSGDNGRRDSIADISKPLGAKATTQIVRLLVEKNQRNTAQRKIASDVLAMIRNDVPHRIEVDISAEVNDDLLRDIQGLGGEVVSSHPEHQSIRAELPLDVIEQIAARSAVRQVRKADLAFTDQTTKQNSSEGVGAHQADFVPHLYGVDGSGIGVGVISNGVDTLAERQSSGDIPSHVTILPGQAGVGDEGTAMLEIVYDLAPGAELFFATGTSAGEASFAANVQSLCDAGADIIVDDVVFLRQTAFQDGVIGKAISSVVADGCLYFSSAGNRGNFDSGSTKQVWEGDFIKGRELIYEGESLGYMHVFDTTASEPHGNEAFRGIHYMLQWSDPLGSSTNDYDLFLINDEDEVVDSSTSIQDGSQDPSEYISELPGSRIVIVKAHNAENRYLRLLVFKGDIQYSTAGSTFGHNASAKTITVGAVNTRGRRFFRHLGSFWIQLGWTEKDFLRTGWYCHNSRQFLFKRWSRSFKT